MEWLGVLLLYLISGFMKKRQQDKNRKIIESDPEWDNEDYLEPEQPSNLPLIAGVAVGGVALIVLYKTLFAKKEGIKQLSMTDLLNEKEAEEAPARKKKAKVVAAKPS